MGVWLVGVADLHSMVGECDCFLCCGLLIRHANYRGKVISFCAPIFSTASRVEKSGVHVHCYLGGREGGRERGKMGERRRERRRGGRGE